MSLSLQLRNIANQVQPHDAAAASRINSLASAVEPDAESGGWEHIDVLRAIDPTEIQSTIRRAPLRSSRLAGFEVARNLLVLAPVLITWFAIDFAASGYSAAINADPDLVNEPFIHLWEQGFHGHGSRISEWLTLSTTATIDFVLILILILLTVHIHLQTNLRQSSIERYAAELSSQLRHLLWEAGMELKLRATPEGQNTRIMEVASGLLDEIRAERDRLADVAQERDNIAIELTRFADVFKESMTDLLHSSESVNEGASRVLDAIAGLQNLGGTDSQQKLHEQLLDSATLMAQASVQSAQVISGATTSIDLLQSELKGIRTELGAERANYTEASEAAVRSATALENVLLTLGESATNIHGGAQQLGELLGPLTNLPQQMRDTDSYLNRTATAFDQSVGSFGQLVEAVEALTTSSQELQAQAQRVIAQAPTAEAMVAAIREVVPSPNGSSEPETGEPHRRRFTWLRRR